MDEKFVWKAEIKFEGTADEFNQLAEFLEAMPVELTIREWWRHPCHFAGCMPIPSRDLLGDRVLKKIAEDMPRIQIKYIKDIYGGIRSPHFHLADEVVLLSRERFKTFVGRVAQELATRRVEAVPDYIGVMGTVGRLADPTPQPI